jgi:hypothetical protein
MRHGRHRVIEGKRRTTPILLFLLTCALANLEIGRPLRICAPARAPNPGRVRVAPHTNKETTDAALEAHLPTLMHERDAGNDPRVTKAMSERSPEK